MNRCRRCGDVISDRRYLCDKCKEDSNTYRTLRSRIRHTTDLKTLLRFRNIIMDMQNCKTGKYIPDDLNYQLDKVNRYLKERESNDN